MFGNIILSIVQYQVYLRATGWFIGFARFLFFSRESQLFWASAKLSSSDGAAEKKRGAPLYRTCDHASGGEVNSSQKDTPYSQPHPLRMEHTTRRKKQYTPRNESNNMNEGGDMSETSECGFGAWGVSTINKRQGYHINNCIA